MHVSVFQMEQLSDEEIDHGAEEDSDKEDQDLDKNVWSLAGGARQTHSRLETGLGAGQENFKSSLCVQILLCRPQDMNIRSSVLKTTI